MSNILLDLHWFNIPELPEKTVSVENPFIFNLLKLTEIPDSYVFIYMGNRTITELDNISHSTNVVNLLNDKGIHFFLYEPLCAYSSKLDRDSFYLEFNNTENLLDIRSEELDSILDYIKRNNLTNVTVHTCDYNSEKAFPYYNEYMNLICDDLFIKTYVIHKDVFHKRKIERKIICSNWRFTSHRYLISSFLSTSKHSFLSWSFKTDHQDFLKRLWFNFEKWKYDEPDLYQRILLGFKKLNHSGPFCLDNRTRTFSNPENIYPSSGKSLSMNPESNSLEPYYKHSFCAVVTESRFAQPSSNYSEKVYHPIRYKNPFILVAPPHTLEYLKKNGFKTFSNFWDESYDEVEHHEARLLKIFKLLEWIESQSLTDLISLYNEMASVLEHNYNTLTEKTLKRY
jgi:hypothetical protein